MISFSRSVKLYEDGGRLVTELELPREFIRPPAVIFYGNRAFHALLVARGEYHECNCWRAPEPEQEHLVALG